MKKSVLFAAMCAATANTYAQTEQTEKENKIERVAVVGSATNLSITKQDIESLQANDLEDIFRKSPSVSVGGSVGVAQKIYVRGLEDAYLNVTVDGAQQTSTLFHHIGRVTLDPDLLKQIDVQAGAGEATSGPGAIGGAIRFKTKDASDFLTGDEQAGGRLKASYFSNDGHRYSATGYGRLTENWGVLGYFSTIDRDNMEDGDGNTIYGTAADQDLVFLKTSGMLTNKQYLSVSFEKRDEKGQFSARPNWYVAEGSPLYDSEAERETWVANYRYDHSNLVYIQATAYQTSSSFIGGRFAWLADIDTHGFDIRNTSEFGAHSLIYGIDYRNDKVESGPADGSPENSEEGSVLGLYIQAHSDITDQLLLSYGMRFDDYDFQQNILIDEYYGDPVTDSPAGLNDSEVSFNLGLDYRINEQWKLALGFAEAARGKEIGDGFTLDEYLYDGSDAPVVSADVVPETVVNVEAAIEYRLKGLHARASVFRSKINDVLFTGFEGSSIYNNIGDLSTEGFEFDVAYQWGSFDFLVGYSHTDTELAPRDGIYSVDYDKIDINGYEFVGLGNSRGDSLVLGMDYTLNSDINMGVNITHVNELTIKTLHQAVDKGWTDSIYDLKKPNYTTVDVYADWTLTADLQLNIAVTNLFDKLYIDHSSVGDYSAVDGFDGVRGPYEAGRDIRVSVTYDF
ncbi:TonB-dependent receptor plug domain-containing protein [Gayadomonas joobiniege]|uniref:TonB-dependent receptor plug domain-containing protein n=1 Tax=Gayadomonas joobiniege TaxID=1234606 RepID=UPI00035DC25B|nr:TonB-dependent receptor [Gayadomonas joobiniege]